MRFLIFFSKTIDSSLWSIEQSQMKSGYLDFLAGHLWILILWTVALFFGFLLLLSWGLVFICPSSEIKGFAMHLILLNHFGTEWELLWWAEWIEQWWGGKGWDHWWNWAARWLNRWEGRVVICMRLWTGWGSVVVK